MHGGAHLSTGGSQLLAQLQPCQEVAHRLLPARDLGAPGGCPEPAREDLLTGLGLRRAQELKERAFPKQVQVLGEEVIRVGEPVSPRPEPRPPVLESCDAVFVPRDGAGDPVASEQHPVVYHDQSDEHGPRQTQPPDRHPVAEDRTPGEHRAHSEGDEPRVAHLVGAPLERRLLTPPLIEKMVVCGQRGGH